MLIIFAIFFASYATLAHVFAKDARERVQARGAVRGVPCAACATICRDTIDEMPIDRHARRLCWRERAFMMICFYAPFFVVLLMPRIKDARRTERTHQRDI